MYNTIGFKNIKLNLSKELDEAAETFKGANKEFVAALDTVF